MMQLKNQLMGSTIVAGVAAVAMIGFAPAAFAQSSSTTQQKADDASTVDEVVVVGSRLRRDNYNAPSPIQVVTREDATLAGFASTTEALQGTAVTGGTSQINNAYGGFVTNGGPGANTLSLRGLGAERTLVLLNGRRVAPAGSRGSVGSADLNVLPSAMVERIEILKDGASSVYGSDAVAGVVNIITRNNIDGVTVEGQYNSPTDAKGAGDQTRLSIVAGTSGDRWRASGSAEYYKRNELRLRDRNFTQCAVDGFTNGQDYIDPLTGRSKCYTVDGGGVTINTIGTSNLTSDARVGLVGVTVRPGLIGANGVPGVAYANGVYFNRWRPNAAASTGLVGFEGVGGAYLDNPDLDLAEGFLGLSTAIRDTFEDRMLNESLISPVEVKTLFLEGSYDLQALGNAEVYGEVLINRRESSQTGYRQLSLDYLRGSPLIPGNLAFSNFSANQGLSPLTGPNANARVGVRAFIGYGNDQSEQTVDFAKSLAGIRGDFVIPGWRYDAYASYTRSKASYTSQQFITSLLRDSLDVVTAPAGMDPRLTRTGILTSGATGTVTCRVNTIDPTAGCIAAPFLNGDTIGGRLPEDWKNYVFRPITGTTEYVEKVISVGFDGPLFSLPAGQVQAYVGAEWRDAEIDDTPAMDMQTGNIFNYSTATPTRGSESVWEVFGEVEAPLLANLPLVQSLTLNASVRYTDYENAGSDSTYKIGLVYAPTSWLTVRGTYGTSYRAPALFEQFLGATSGFLTAPNDPCNELTATSNPNRVANCTSLGLGNFVATQGVRVFTLGGAANNLKPETSDNLTVGFVFQPQLPSGWGELSFATDYYEIEINNSVVRLGGAAILSDCYNSSTSDFNARVGNCSFITRDPANNALTVESSYINIATDTAKGLDYTLRYRRDVGPGKVTFNLGVTQVTDSSSQTLPTDPVRNQKGRINVPEFSGYSDVTYAWDNWRVRYGVEYIQGTSDQDYYLREYGDDYAAEGYNLTVPDYFLHNASVQYRTDNWTATVGVRNIFNQDPPSITTGVYNRVGNAPLYSGYDYVGRSAFVNLSKSF
ncbi:TonB-dependent receptor [Brevundimonas sp.]|uniref:TonB-dependent receptor domain-containing protein n=1 Tax=Brevundimonas sp. TaxID=1871086 RepID=UPI0025BD4A80|nr:TonB-dependent receptor [Brevundimonas sp.]